MKGPENIANGISNSGICVQDSQIRSCVPTGLVQFLGQCTHCIKTHFIYRSLHFKKPHRELKK